MTNIATITVAAELAATAAMANVPIADALLLGSPIEYATPLAFSGVAVSARFTGDYSGEVLVAVEQSIADALQNSPLGALDITAALAPALNAAAATVGNVVIGPGQALTLGPALDALLSKERSAVVPLTNNGQIRALVGLMVTVDEVSAIDVNSGAAAPMTPAYPTRSELDAQASGSVRAFSPTPVARHGLEMLRDVAMEVTAQIGSTRMTVSELLSLSDGAVIELDRAAGAPADLLVNGHLIARGEVVVVDENFGLRITEIVSTEATSPGPL
ncbi:flagellar motor switch protein FliN [Jatrophihabitans sp. DSM 45814]